jgi:NAD(P)H-dependent FMN reductase
MALTLMVLYGSYRFDRKGIRLAQYLTRMIGERGHTADLVDAQAVNLPMLDRMHKEYAEGEAPAPLADLATRIRACDGVIAVAGEYNHGVQPGLKNLVDHFLEEWFYRPSAIAAYSAGGFAGVRAAMAWRMILAELGMPTIPTVLTVPRIGQAFDTYGVPEDREAMDRRTGRFLDELDWYAGALKAARATGTP